MICTYEEYLKQPKAISFEKMQMIHAEMLAEIGADTEALELYDELMKIATRYAAIRANWPLLSREEKNEHDSGRTSCHNSVITHFNFFFREFMFLLLLDSFYDRIRVIRQICDSWINWLFYRGRIGLIDIIQNYTIILRVNFR